MRPTQYGGDAGYVPARHGASTYMSMGLLLKPENSKGELINYISGSYWISHVMNERLGKKTHLEKPEGSKQVN